MNINLKRLELNSKVLVTLSEMLYIKLGKRVAVMAACLCFQGLWLFPPLQVRLDLGGYRAQIPLVCLLLLYLFATF